MVPALCEGRALLTTGVILFASSLFAQKRKPMEVAVWDTYVRRKDGRVMHFDILVPAEVKDTAQIFAYGRAYLQTKGEGGQPLDSRHCRFCHIERARPEWEKAIREKGYAIFEMENCD